MCHAAREYTHSVKTCPTDRLVREESEHSPPPVEGNVVLQLSHRCSRAPRSRTRLPRRCVDAIGKRLPRTRNSEVYCRATAAQGARDDALCILVDGSVEVFVRHRPFPDRVLDRLSAGSVFGEVSFFDGGVRSASIRAHSDGTLLRMTRRKFDVLAAWEPRLGQRILADLGKILASRLRRMTRMMGS